jgi:vesicle-associated membrane protein 7
MSILYSLIAEKTEILSQYPTNKKNITDTVVTILTKIPTIPHKHSYNHEVYVFHYKCTGNFTYLCISTKDFPLRLSFSFLDDIETQHARSKDASSLALSNIMRDRIAHFNNLDNDKVSLLKKEVDVTKEVILENIDKIIERGEKLDRLVDDTTKLSEGAQKFSKGSKKLSNKMCLRNILLIFMILLVILVLVFIVIWFICGFPAFDRCQRWFAPNNNNPNP